MLSRRVTTATPHGSLPSETFLVKVTGVAAGAHTFDEWELTAAGTIALKAGGRFASASNPGRSVTGVDIPVGSFAEARSADGTGGLAWELSMCSFGGDVVGPAGAVAQSIAVFADATGKVIKSNPGAVGNYHATIDTTGNLLAQTLGVFQLGGYPNPAFATFHPRIATSELWLWLGPVGVASAPSGQLRLDRLYTNILGANSLAAGAGVFTAPTGVTDIALVASAGHDSAGGSNIAEFRNLSGAVILGIGIGSCTFTTSTGLYTFDAPVTVTGTVTATLYSGSGASLTTLNASNLSSGTVPTARLGSGTADATTFLRGDNTWQVPAGGSFQPLDATLTAFAALTIAADSLTVGTGADAFTQTTFAANTFPARASTGNLVAKTITDFALTLLDDAAAANARTTLGLGTAAVEATGTTGHTIPFLDGSNIWTGTQSFAFADAGTNNSPTTAVYGHNSSATPVDGFGLTVQYNLESSTTADQFASVEVIKWATAAHATRKARRTIEMYDTAARECLRMEASGTAPMVGFLGANAVVRQTGDIGAALIALGLMSATATLPYASLTGAPPVAPNVLHNGGFNVWQRGTPFTTADDNYGADRWYSLTQTSTVSQTQTTGTEGARYACLLTQTQASAQRMGIAQIVERIDCAPYQGRVVRFQFKAKASTNTVIRWAVIEHHGTEDVVTSDPVQDWTSATYTPSNFFIAGVTIPSGSVQSGTALSSGWTEFSTSVTVGAGSTNLILMVWTEGTVAQNVTITLTEMGLYDGNSSATWLPKSIAEDFSTCHRYALKIDGYMLGDASFGSTTYNRGVVAFPVRMRMAPSLASSPASSFAVNAGSAGTVAMGTAQMNSTNFTNSANNWTVGAIVTVSAMLSADL